MPTNAPMEYAPPPRALTPPPSMGIMDGVDILHKGQLQSGVLEGCLEFVKSYPGGKIDKESDMARYLKDKMEAKFGKHWQVIVSSSTVGCLVAHEPQLFMHFRYKNYLFIIYRIPNYGK